MVYDFSLPGFDEVFRNMASANRMYIDSQVENMRDAKAQHARKGLYYGKPLQPGFIVDRDKHSETFGRYIPYQPHAEVTARLYARYRELGGQFNLLAAEVARMPFVFPDFEDWVDPKDVRKFRFRKVAGGYHVSKNSLRSILTAIEMVGYWKFQGELLTDASGKPVLNHEPIVDYADWQYAFERLSWENLDGSDNRARVNGRATWQPATYKRQERKQEALLQGILTAPDGGTVQYTQGKYVVTERRPETMHRSATLVMDANIVDTMFMDRMQDRYLEIGMRPYDRIIEELTSVQEQNSKALATVDKQIAGYERSIASKQAVMAALGTSIDIPTAQKYNAEIIEDREQMNALIAKRDAAAAEESKLLELHE
jgi:hypothetical protein